MIKMQENEGSHMLLIWHLRLTNISFLLIGTRLWTTPETWLKNLKKGLVLLRELQDDGQEYVECLQEIREGLGIVKFQRDKVWQMVCEKAIQELQDAAFSSV